MSFELDDLIIKSGDLIFKKNGKVSPSSWVGILLNDFLLYFQYSNGEHGLVYYTNRVSSSSGFTIA